MPRAVLAFEKIENFNQDGVQFSEERIKQAESYRFDDDKKRCLLAEVLLKKGLAKFGLDTSELRYEFNEHKKPYLKNVKDVYFNISHSGDYVLCVVSDCEIGIDIEKIDPINLRIAERFFTKSEFEAISSEPESKLYEAFYSYWTRKEAYVKYLGEGMSHGFNSFDVRDDLNCFFKELDLFPGYKCSICSQEAIDEIEII